MSSQTHIPQTSATRMKGGATEAASAERVVEHILARTSAALFAGDFVGYARHFAWPVRFETFDGAVVLRDRAALRRMFDMLRDRYLRLGASDLVRRCVVASFPQPGVLVAMHEVRLVGCGHQLLERPYPVMCRYEWRGGAWRICSSQHAISANSHFGQAVLATGAALPPERAA